MNFVMKTSARATAIILSTLALTLAGPAGAQTPPDAGLEEVRTQVAEAMDAIAAYSAAQREAAIAEAREALDAMDAAVAARQKEMREGWAQMTEAAREDTNERLAELQSALVGLAERVGRLQAGADSAWDELNSGLVAAWDELSAAVETSLEPMGRSE